MIGNKDLATSGEAASQTGFAAAEPLPRGMVLLTARLRESITDTVFEAELAT